MNGKTVSDLSDAVCAAINGFVDNVSLSEIVGVLEVVKHFYITEAIEQDDTNEDDTE